MLTSQGYEIAEEPERADVILLNTCSVRQHAEEQAVGNMGELSLLKRERPGRGEELKPQPLVDRVDPLECLWAQLEQPSPQSRGIGETPEPQQMLRAAVVLQEPRLAQPWDAGDHGGEDGQEQIGRMVAVDPLVLERDVLLEEPLQPELFAKPVDRQHPAEVGEVRLVEGDAGSAQPFGHLAERSLEGQVVPRQLLGPDGPIRSTSEAPSSWRLSRE